MKWKSYLNIKSHEQTDGKFCIVCLYTTLLQFSYGNMIQTTSPLEERRGFYGYLIYASSKEAHSSISPIWHSRGKEWETVKTLYEGNRAWSWHCQWGRDMGGCVNVRLEPLLYEWCLKGDMQVLNLPLPVTAQEEDELQNGENSYLSWVTLIVL